MASAAHDEPRSVLLTLRGRPSSWFIGKQNGAIDVSSEDAHKVPDARVILDRGLGYKTTEMR